MNNINAQNLVISPLSEIASITQNERPELKGLKDILDANAVRVNEWLEENSHTNNPFHPHSQGSNGLAHSDNPARLLGMDFNYISHRSKQEIEFHKALLRKNEVIKSQHGADSTFIFSMNPVFIQIGRKRIEIDCIIFWQNQTLAIEIDGDSHCDKTHFDEEERLLHLKENFIDIRRIKSNSIKANWADNEVQKTIDYLLRKKGAS